MLKKLGNPISNTFQPSFKHCVEILVEIISAVSESFCGYGLCGFHFFQNPAFHRFLKVENCFSVSPQNFPHFFPFHSTISPQFHTPDHTLRISHFFTFSPIAVCEKRTMEFACFQPLFNFSAPSTTTTILFLLD